MGENAKNALSRGVSLEGKERVYTIEEVLGAGGFGITYKVSATVEVGNIEIDSTFAVKEHFLSEACERDVATSRVKCSAPVRDRVANSLTDFVAEARRLQSIKHPNIVKVSEVFEANDTAYYVMEYIKGSSLRRYIDKNGVLSESQALTVITPILNAINYLHQNRMTHLDIKPDNIMLKPGRDGELTPVLIDFGLSKHYDESGKATSTIRTLGCSDGYAPPEQYAGILTFTPQADVYALGATMFFLMTGIQPEKSTEIDDDYVAKSMPTTISEGTRDAIIHAMNPLRKSRTQSVADYARELGIALDDVTPSSVSSEILTQQIGKPNPGKKDNSTEIVAPNNPKPTSSKWLMPMLIALGVIAVGVIVWLAVGMFEGGDSKLDTTDTSKDSSEKIEQLIVDEPQQPVADAEIDQDVEIEETEPTPVEETNSSTENVNTQSSAPTVSGNYSSHASSSQRAAIDELLGNMVWVAGGTYTMGATSEQGSDAYSDEKPAHAETVGGFYLCKYEVTQKLWSAVMGSNPSYWKGDDLPVESVSWNDCQEFISKLNELTNNKYGFRLPTEAEWEYAARGGNRSRGYKYSGSDNVGSVAWYDGNSGSRTHAVGGKSPNELGLYDMSGNVCEWTASKWCDDYNSPRNSSLRVLRGGGWYYFAGFCRVSSRGYGAPGYRYDYGGLRLAR